MLHHAVLQKNKKTTPKNIENIFAKDKERYVPSHVQVDET